ncbi:MAG: nitroreductase [Novosphingobium sp.]
MTDQSGETPEYALLSSVFHRRHSCRAFRADPVAPADLDRMVRLASRAASWCNTQPWHLSIAGPVTTNHLRRDLAACARHGPGEREIMPEPHYQGVYLDRRRLAGWRLYEHIGIAKGDRGASREQALRNFDFFGAPQIAVVSCDRALGPYGMVDCGAFVCAFLLAAETLGLGAIALASVVSYPGVLRRYLPVPADNAIVCAIAFGHERDDPVNAFRTNRATIDEFCTLTD